MKANVQFGRIWNIPIGINYSWLLIFALATWSIAMGFFPSVLPGLNVGAYWLLGVITSLLFFGSVLAHELGHAALALRNDVPVRAITLFFFGGVAQITREPRTAGAEFRIAIAGPLVSVALAGVFGLIALLGQGTPVIAAPALWLARINLMLAAFNMLPGFPLDGGRVLRAIIWRATQSEMRATHLASLVGQVVAFGFVGVGVVNALTGDVFNGLWLVFLGLFLNSAAAGSRQQARMQRALQGVTVGQMMSRNVLRVPSWVTVGDLLTPSTLSQGQRAFLVEDFGQLRGMLTLAVLSRVPRADWRMLKVEQVMTPRDKLVVIQPETDIQAAMQLMEERNLPQLLVMDIAESEVWGVLSSEQIFNYLRVQAELAARSGKVSSQTTV
jgi:Zn-dependent protease